jgi:hypothetical protein
LATSGLLSSPRTLLSEPDGTRYDITPAPRASQQYPFLQHPGTDDEFAALVNDLGVVNLPYPGACGKFRVE